MERSREKQKKSTKQLARVGLQLRRLLIPSLHEVKFDFELNGQFDMN